MPNRNFFTSHSKPNIQCLVPLSLEWPRLVLFSCLLALLICVLVLVLLSAWLLSNILCSGKLLSHFLSEWLLVEFSLCLLLFLLVVYFPPGLAHHRTIPAPLSQQMSKFSRRMTSYDSVHGPEVPSIHVKIFILAFDTCNTTAQLFQDVFLRICSAFSLSWHCFQLRTITRFQSSYSIFLYIGVFL